MSLSAFPLIVHHSERFRRTDKLQPLHCPAVACCHIVPSSSLSSALPQRLKRPLLNLSLPSQSILFSLSISLGSNPSPHFISLFPFSFLAQQRKRFYRIYSINRCNLTPLFLSAELQALPISLSLSLSLSPSLFVRSFPPPPPPQRIWLRLPAAALHISKNEEALFASRLLFLYFMWDMALEACAARVNACHLWEVCFGGRLRMEK